MRVDTGDRHVADVTDSVEEFCAGAPGRYIPPALLPVWSIEDSVEEVHRAAKMGHKGVCWGGSMDIFGMPWNAPFDATASGAGSRRPG